MGYPYDAQDYVLPDTLLGKSKLVKNILLECLG